MGRIGQDVIDKCIVDRIDRITGRTVTEHNPLCRYDVGCIVRIDVVVRKCNLNRLGVTGAYHRDLVKKLRKRTSCDSGSYLLPRLEKVIQRCEGSDYLERVIIELILKRRIGKPEFDLIGCCCCGECIVDPTDPFRTPMTITIGDDVATGKGTRCGLKLCENVLQKLISVEL